MTDKIVGILGGMGPFASAEFVFTIYEENIGLGHEQECPRVFLSSDPNIPDRTTSIMVNGRRDFVETLIRHWNRLAAAGAELFIIPCMTSHYYWESLPGEVKLNTISLLNVAYQAVANNVDKKFLLLATKGTYVSEMFKHPQIVIPGKADQETIHRMIYLMKEKGPSSEILDFCGKTAEELLADYSADSWVFGCTELHLLTRRISRFKDDPRIVDPLLILAKQWRNLERFLSNNILV